MNYYQVLVHRGDWKDMVGMGASNPNNLKRFLQRFAHDQTAYLSEAPNQEGKTLSTVFGMDSVPLVFCVGSKNAKAAAFARF